MIELMLREEILAWLRMKWPKGGKRGVERDLPTLWFCRMVNVDPRDFFKYRDEIRPLPMRLVVSMTRFIRKWENGEIDVPVRERWRGPYQTEHVKTPKPRAVTMRVSWQGGAKLTIMPRPKPMKELPSIKDFFAPIDTKQKRA